jgi:hypothetical protein
LLTQLASGAVPFDRVLALGAGFALVASVIFGVTGILSYPAVEKLTLQQGTMRFLFLTGLMFGIAIPLKILIGGLLQRYTSWFLNLDLDFPKTLGLMLMATGIHALMLACSIPVFLIKNTQPWVFEAVMFGLNIAAFILTLRWIATAYRVYCNASGKKAWLAAWFPPILVVVMAGLTWGLTWFAMQHRGMM